MSLYRSAANPVGVIIAVGSNGLITKSADGGATWATQVSGTANDLYGVAWGYAYGEERWVAVGQNGMILSSPDGGSWTLRAPFTGQTLTSVAFPGVFIAVGMNGVIGLSDDLGATWEEKSSGTVNDLYEISFSTGTYTIVGGNDTFIVGSISVLEMECFVRESMFLGAEETSKGTFQHNSSERVGTVDGYGWHHIAAGTLVETAGGQLQHAVVIDNVGSYDYGTNITGSFNQAVTEAIGLIHDFIGSAKYASIVTEIASCVETTVDEKRITRMIIESLATSDTISSSLALILSERLNILTQPVALGAFRREITETLSMRDTIILAWLALISESVNVTDSATGKFEIAEALVEKMVATEAVQSRLLAVASVAIALILSEAVASGKGAGVTESFTLTDALLDQFKAYCAAIEAVTMTMTAAMTMRISVPITETTSLDDDFATTAKFRELIADGVAFELIFNAGGETYLGWVMNTTNFGVTEYQDYPFNSLAKFNGVYLGANSNGVYKLEGATDAGADIAASLKTGVTTFSAKTNIPEAFISFRSDGSILLKTITDEKIERWHTVTGSENISRKRAKMALGVKSSYWQFELSNIDGSTLELESLELVPVVLSRKI